MKDSVTATGSDIIPALLTPYTRDGGINRESMKKHIELLIKQGVSGFYINGSTGEGLLLDENERMETVLIAAEAINKRAKLIVQVGALSEKQSQRLARHAASAGADAVSSLPPLYYKYSFPQIKEHYIKIAEAAEIPMIVYNIPSFSGVSLSTEQIKELASHSLIKGIKHSSPNVYELERIKAALPDFQIFYGMDEQYLAGRVMGASSFIGSTYNLMTPLYKKLYNAFLEGNTVVMSSLTHLINDSVCDLISADLMPAIKYLLDKHFGTDFNGCREPMANLTEKGRDIADSVFERIEKYL